MSIFENEWVELPHVDFVGGEMAAEKWYEYSRLEFYNGSWRDEAAAAATDTSKSTGRELSERRIPIHNTLKGNSPSQPPEPSGNRTAQSGYCNQRWRTPEDAL
jgi:hypothetical protein